MTLSLIRTRSMAAAAFVMAVFASPLAAYAHDDAYLDSLKAPHGGQLRMAGPLHLELVLETEAGQAKVRPVVVYVNDHADKPQAAHGAKGTVTLLMGKTKVSTPLKPDGENRLIGHARYSAVPGLKAIVSVTLPGQEAQQARFTPVPARAAPASEPHSHSH